MGGIFMIGKEIKYPTETRTEKIKRKLQGDSIYIKA